MIGDLVAAIRDLTKDSAGLRDDAPASSRNGCRPRDNGPATSRLRSTSLTGMVERPHDRDRCGLTIDLDDLTIWSCNLARMVEDGVLAVV